MGLLWLIKYILLYYIPGLYSTMLNCHAIETRNHSKISYRLNPFLVSVSKFLLVLASPNRIAQFCLVLEAPLGGNCIGDPIIIKNH